MKNSIISCSGLTKKFRIYKKDPGIRGALKSFYSRIYTDNSAVDDFNLEIQPGELVGLLGPNGAGKTTLMKMWTGIIKPSRGDLKVLGYDPFKRKVDFRKKIALVMGQKSQLWWDIPALDSFLLLQRYYEVSNSDFKARLDRLTEVLNVKSLLKIHIRKLSLGERMKMELIACLLHKPEIIFLDEPTIGLDLVAQENIRNFLTSYQKETNCTIILTSHYMADVEALCDRIVLLLDGKKRFDGSKDEFATLFGKEKVVTIRFNHSIDQSHESFLGLDPIFKHNGCEVDLRINDEQFQGKIQNILSHFSISDISTEKMPIERVMKKLLTENL